MARIALEAEYELGDDIYERYTKEDPEEHTDAIAAAVAILERQLVPSAVVTTSTSGQTPRLVSKYRPKAKILCASWRPETVAYMAVVWGVSATLVPQPSTTDDVMAAALETFTNNGCLHSGDLVILTGGVPAGKAGNTNMIMTQVVK
jgi:pyruvate kinase